MVKAIVTIEIPTCQASAQALTLGHLEQLLLKLIKARVTDLTGISEGAKPDDVQDTQPEEVVTKASEPEYKVNKVHVSDNAVLIR
jgi:hypothetical protein